MAQGTYLIRKLSQVRILPSQHMNTASIKLIPPAGKFRVVVVDTFSNEDYVLGDFDVKYDAMMAAMNRGGTMQKAYVYDGNGRRLGNFGNY